MIHDLGWFNFGESLTTLTQRIAEQKAELEDLQEQRKRTQSKTVRTMLDDQIETLGLTIDEMDERLTTLQADALTQPYTDEHIEEAIAELKKLREMYEALETINEESDFEAKRALINILNLKPMIRSFLRQGFFAAQ